jgi:hypothetical protein
MVNVTVFGGSVEKFAFYVGAVACGAFGGGCGLH